MTATSLYDEYWLLAYEANVRAWLPNVSGDHVAADKWFSQLKTANVRFYKSTIDVTATLLRRLQARRGDSYGDDDDDEDDDEVALPLGLVRVDDEDDDGD